MADDDMEALAAALQSNGLESAEPAVGSFPSRSKDAKADESSDDGMDVSKGKKKKKMGGFKGMGLTKELTRGIQRKGYQVPTPIQRRAIPILMDGNDVVAMARTGSGKTAAFLVPLINKLVGHSPTVGARGMVLSPTRELAIQTLRFAKQLGKFTDLRYCVIVGGLALSEQFTDLAGNPDVLIGTPGRMLHIIMEADIKLRRMEFVVLDEADRLFETGSLSAQVNDLMKRLPDNRQIALFSATIPAGLAEFATAGLNNPSLIRLDSEIKISDKLQLSFFIVRREEKLAALLFMIRELLGLPEQKSQTIVFVPTKHHGEMLYLLFNAMDLKNSLIHGSMDQEARKNELDKFAHHETCILVVTDVAARGIDIPLLDNVINFEFPDRPKLFVHRAGRAARAGRSGKCLSIITKDELPHVYDLHLFLGRPLRNSIEEKEEADKEEDEASAEEEEEDEEEEEAEEEEKPTPEETKPINLNDGFMGKIPGHLLHDDTQNVESLTRNIPEILAQGKTCSNALKLYTRTRKGATSESIKKANKMYSNDEIRIHPLLLTDKFHCEREVEKASILKQLSQFRPQANIFESTKQGARSIFQGSRITKESQFQKKSSLAKSLAAATIAAREEAAAAKNKSRSELLRENLLKTKGAQAGGQNKITEKLEKEKAGYYIPYTRDISQADRDEAGYQVNDMKDAVFDMTGDSRETMEKQRQVFVWKAKTSRYVKMNLGDAKSTLTKARNESGKKIEFKKGEQGRMLRKWEMSSHSRIQQVGEEEDASLYDPNRRKRTQEMILAEQDTEEQKSDKRIKLGRKGKKKEAIRSAEVKSFDTMAKEKKLKISKSKKNKGRGPSKPKRTGGKR